MDGWMDGWGCCKWHGYRVVMGLAEGELGRMQIGGVRGAERFVCKQNTGCRVCGMQSEARRPCEGGGLFFFSFQGKDWIYVCVCTSGDF